MYRLDISLTAPHTGTQHRYIGVHTLDGLTAEELRALVGAIENAVLEFFASRTEE